MQINSAVCYSTQSSQMIDLFLQVGWRWDYTSTASALASAAASTANAACAADQNDPAMCD